MNPDILARIKALEEIVKSLQFNQAINRDWKPTRLTANDPIWTNPDYFGLKPDPTLGREIPEGILRMARAVEDYMATQTSGDWELMGIRNRFPKEPNHQQNLDNSKWEKFNEQRELLDWAETILMSAQHDPSVRASDWLDARKAWQDAKHNPDKSIKGKPDPIRSSPEPDCQPKCGPHGPKCGCDQTQPQ